MWNTLVYISSLQSYTSEHCHLCWRLDFCCMYSETSFGDSLDLSNGFSVPFSMVLSGKWTFLMGPNFPHCA